MRSNSTSSLQDHQAIALAGKILGSLFYYEPNHAAVSMIYPIWENQDWLNEWPSGELGQLQPIAELMQQGLHFEDESLNRAFQRLFIGPNSLKAPPWGSVYLDHENVIFGESTLELFQWQKGLGIAVELQQREPEDHIGLLLMQAAWLVENQPEQLNVLLEQHLLPWSKRYLELFVEHAAHPFYQGLGQLTQITLQDWQVRLGIEPVKKQIYY